MEYAEVVFLISQPYYPTKKQNVNKANYQHALSVQGNDKIETKPWVFKK